MTDRSDAPQLEPPMSSSSFGELIKKLTSSVQSTQNISTVVAPEKKPNKSSTEFSTDAMSEQSTPSTTVQPNPPRPKRSCKVPLSRKFGHPCSCGGQSNLYGYKPFSNINNNPANETSGPTSPIYLYDPLNKTCLPTTRNMLLRDCHTHIMGNSIKLKQPCVYDDLVCDPRRYRCICKPPLHLYYDSNQTAFGCVPLGPSVSPDGFKNCRSGCFYNVITKECQKIFDVNELPPNYATGVSATQFSFVTIVLIWILLLILVVTAKLRKLRTSNVYRNSPMSQRRSHGAHGTPYRHQQQTTSAWLHPFIAAVNGHHHLNHHRRTVDRHSQSVNHSDEIYNDTDFFLHNGSRRFNDMLTDSNLASSQQSLNNPPPKFEEIYPSCPPIDEQVNIRPPSNEDLPSYDEAMKLQNTMPPPGPKE